MLELIINNQKDNKLIELVENGKLIELYEENDNEKRREGNIYIGTIKDIIKGMQSAFMDIGTERNCFIHIKDILPKIDETKIKDESAKKDISEIIKPEQRLLVQIKKDSNDKKGARVSTHINITGRYIVFTPNTQIITISQKIEDQKERERLLEIVKNNISKGNGAIIRTQALGKTNEIIEDLKLQEDKWKKILQEYNKNYQLKNLKKEEKLIYKNDDIIGKMLLDLTDKHIEKIILNNKEDYKTIKELLDANIELKNIKIEEKESAEIENLYDMKKQIEKAQNRKVWLKNGAFISIDKTEALTSIDVNTGKFTGTKELEETIYNVNKEATIEVAKQIRLRDIGGIIIIDYIDMKSEKNKQKIEKLLREKVKEDRTKVQVEGFTKLDLMEITRKHICSHKD